MMAGGEGDEKVGRMEDRPHVDSVSISGKCTIH